MKIYLGEKGLPKSWQDDFPEETKCHKCKGNCRIMFVGFEEYKEGSKYVCNLQVNMKDGKYWPHDCVAVAVYCCEKCFEPNAIINQA